MLILIASEYRTQGEIWGQYSETKEAIYAGDTSEEVAK